MEFGKMKRGEIKAAVELASRAFDDYVYFTNHFPDDEERKKVMRAIIYREYITNYGRTHYLTTKIDGNLVATAQLNAPGYKRASDISYLLHGWLQNIDYYRKRGYEVFHETEIVHEGKTMGSWSVKKVL